MKVETIKHVCDRCGATITASEYIRQKMGLEVKRVVECKIFFRTNWESYDSPAKSYDLCNICREGLERWLNMKTPDEIKKGMRRAPKEEA